MRGSMESKEIKEIASYIALRLPERLPLRGDRNEAAKVIERLLGQALAAGQERSGQQKE
jgi:hypothetical protein